MTTARLIATIFAIFCVFIELTILLPRVGASLFSSSHLYCSRRAIHRTG
jgi:hypothetical protein